MEEELHSIREVRIFEDFLKLGKLWNEIASKNSTYHPYCTHEWFRIWLSHFLNSDQLLILVLYRKDEPELIAPFLIKRERLIGIPIRRVELIGNYYSPMRTFIFREMDNKKREDNVRQILHYFRKINKNWEVIDLESLLEENDTFRILCEALKKANLKNREYFCFGNWFSPDINYSSDSYFKSRSRNLRASIKKNYRNTRCRGNLEFKLITEINGIEKYISEYFEVYRKSWKREEKAGPNYIVDLIKYNAKEGWLRLGLVILEGVTIGAGFAIVCNGFAYLAKTAYDEKYADLGPGSIWLAEMIKHIIDVDKVKVIDLLRGDEDYKKLWVASRRERKGILVYNNNIKGKCLALFDKKIFPLLNKNKYARKIKEIIRNRLRHAFKISSTRISPCKLS